MSAERAGMLMDEWQPTWRALLPLLIESQATILMTIFEFERLSLASLSRAMRQRQHKTLYPSLPSPAPSPALPVCYHHPRRLPSPALVQHGGHRIPTRACCGASTLEQSCRREDVHVGLCEHGACCPAYSRGQARRWCGRREREVGRSKQPHHRAEGRNLPCCTLTPCGELPGDLILVHPGVLSAPWEHTMQLGPASRTEDSTRGSNHLYTRGCIRDVVSY